MTVRDADHTGRALLWEREGRGHLSCRSTHTHTQTPSHTCTPSHILACTHTQCLLINASSRNAFNESKSRGDLNQ